MEEGEVSDGTSTTPPQQPQPAATEPQPLPAVTSPEEWKRRARAIPLLRLPSGFVVRAKRPDWFKLGTNGTLDPNELVEIQGLNGVEMIAKSIDMATRLLPIIVIEPAFAADKEGAVDPADMDSADKMALFGWAFSGRIGGPGGVEQLTEE